MMSAPLPELVWVASLLGYCPKVEILSIRVQSGSIPIAGSYVSVVDLDVHAKGCDDAARLAAALHLAEGEGRTSDAYDGSRYRWRCWEGWVPEASHEVAVRVAVTAAEHVAEAVA